MPETTQPRRHSPGPASATASPQRGRRWLLLILLAAAALRLGLAAAMPCISRDGVVFCNHARALGQRGPEMLRDPAMQQHPLYPAAILLTQRIASLFGAPDTPIVWQRCGQAVALLAGLGLVAVIWAMSVRLVRDLALPVPPAAVGHVAALLAAVLPLGAALSADVMSDPLHALLYLLGLYLAMRCTTAPAAFGTGLLAGLAFLTRPEGAAVAPAAWAAILARRTELRWKRVATLGLLVGAGFLVCAGPYWSLTGRLSTKKSPLELLGDVTVPQRPAPCERDHRRFFSLVRNRDDADTAPAVTQARLKLIELPMWACLPWVFYTLLRAGRVVIVVFGLAAAWRLRHALLSPALAGWTTAALLHLSLTTALLAHWHYLAPRHLLIVVLLLIPLAAVAFVHLWLTAPARVRPWVRTGLVACVLVLLAYALRIPNGADAHLPRMARWIEQHIPRTPRPTLIGGWSQIRVAFYARLPFEHWSEEPDDVPSLVQMILNLHRPLVLLETGPGFEREAHAVALHALRSDPRLSGRLRVLHEEPGDRGARLLLLEYTPPGSPGSAGP